MPTNTLNTVNKGKLGEDIACMFLMKHGYSVLSRNYRKKWGEIDIVAEKSGKIFFIEVKSMFYTGRVGVSRESYRPEDNVTPLKKSKLSRVIESYIASKGLATAEWYFMVAAVFINSEARRAKVSLTEDVIS